MRCTRPCAAPLGTLLADTPLTLAETASIFGEGLVFEHLLAGASKPSAQGLLAGKIEDGLNTVVRQIAFHRFETRFHAARAGGRTVAPSRSAACGWRCMAESLGPADPAERRLRALLGLYQPLRARALLRLRLCLRGPAGARPGGEAPRGPGRLRAALRGPARRRRHQDLCRGAEAVRPEPAREGLLGGRHARSWSAWSTSSTTWSEERRACRRDLKSAEPGSTTPRTSQTFEALHLFSQIVGKARTACAPWVNHG